MLSHGDDTFLNRFHARIILFSIFLVQRDPFWLVSRVCTSKKIYVSMSCLS